VAAYASLSGALLQNNNLSDLANVTAARTNLGLGTAATTASTDYATAAQGALADSALQSFTETDPVFSASEAASITSTDTTNWDTAYGWGDHGAAGYADASTVTTALAGKLDTTHDMSLTLSGDVSGSATFTNMGNATLSVTVADDSHNHTIANVDGLQAALDGKVDDSQVLTNVPAGAVFTDTVYSHPTYAGDDFSIDTGALTGATVISDIDINVTTDTLGHVTDANATVATRNLTAADIGAQPAGTYNTIIGTDTDINTSGSTIIDNIYVTDGVITSMGTRTLTLADLGAGSLASLSSVGAAQITDNSVGAAELNVSGNGASNQFLRSDGDGSFTWDTAGGGAASSTIQVFTASGTWTKPSGCTKVKVTVVGGGGAGGGTDTYFKTATGGGAGGTAIGYIDVSSVSSVSVTVGAGGTGNTSTGGSGGTSSFGSYCSATGGGGGEGRLAASSGYAGAGGVGVGGTININGGGGYATTYGSAAASGEGGVSFMGGGSRGARINGARVNGLSGEAYGSGGGGGYSLYGAPNYSANGGAGKAGVVIVEEWY
jgi:hypothetical protein